MKKSNMYVGLDVHKNSQWQWLRLYCRSPFNDSPPGWQSYQN
jgi:hypothetical protein